MFDKKVFKMNRHTLTQAFARGLHLLFIAALAAFLLGTLPVPAAHAATITVAAGVVTIAADGQCSLREAIQNANNDAATNADCPAGSGADTIELAASSTYTLPDFVDATPPDGQNGLPSITSPITINGNGATVQRAALACTINGTQVASEFRVLRISGAGNLTLNNVTVSNGCADVQGGGGGLLSRGQVTLNNSTISGNTGYGGGGVLNMYGPMTVNNSTISGNNNNHAADVGGGLYNYAGTVTINDSTISGNNSALFGGGLYNLSSGVMTINNSTISGNSAVQGGGLVNDGSTVTLTNSTISGNSASGLGGGLHNYEGTMTINNSTISANTASTGGGIYNESGGLPSTVNIKNSIVANSTGGNCSSGGGNVTLIASGANISSDGTCTGFSLPNTNPQLGALANNGGSTQTHALLMGSPAIDAVTDCTAIGGGAIATDQRGVARPIDGDGNGTATCDIGSYEAPVPSTPTPTPTSTATTAPTATPSPTSPPAPPPFVPPTGSLSVGSGGNTFPTGSAQLTIPAGAVPDGSFVQLGPFDPNAATAAPTGFQFMGQMINVLILDSTGAALHSFNPPLTICFTYTDADLLAAGGDPNNFVIQTAQIGGAWTELTTTVNPNTRQACATTDHLTLFELTARVPTSLPVTGENFTPFIIAALLAGALAAARVIFGRRRGE